MAGADHVAEKAAVISGTSQKMADGASHQAASLEETSGSIEEMAGTTSQNAEHAKKADQIMKAANQVVSQAEGSMQNLTTSMEDIHKASDETSKIIKTIDEIAFQTNLLALNAAVEAARAGDAGAGFAVVADEVRNLAIRAADAARSTAQMIEGTVVKVKSGTELVNRTNEDFGQVAGRASEVANLLTEIASASDEQANGISQINSAVSDMDMVVQQSAADLQESASASQGMKQEAENMRGVVNELSQIFGSSSNLKKDRIEKTDAAEISQ
jgi:methyl-accepting chemotaxis protein